MDRVLRGSFHMDWRQDEQIYAAIIIYSLLCYTKLLCNLRITLLNFKRILQLNLFRTCSVLELFKPLGSVPDNMNVINKLILALIWEI
jgi:hypothetical protein